MTTPHKLPVNFEVANFEPWFRVAASKVLKVVVTHVNSVIEHINEEIQDIDLDLGETVTERVTRDIHAKGFKRLESEILNKAVAASSVLYPY